MLAKYTLHFHCMQVQNWLGNNKLDAMQWGWELRDKMLFPTITDLPPAPKDLFKIIKCSCMGSCDTLRCTCRKNGIECSVSCKNCKGISCKNSKIIEEDVSDAEEWKTHSIHNENADKIFCLLFKMALFVKWGLCIIGVRGRHQAGVRVTIIFHPSPPPTFLWAAMKLLDS